MGEIVDGESQKFSIADGEYVRQQFFGTDPELLDMVSHLTGDQIRKMRRGGHDPEGFRSLQCGCKSQRTANCDSGKHD